LYRAWVRGGADPKTARGRVIDLGAVVHRCLVARIGSAQHEDPAVPQSDGIVFVARRRQITRRHEAAGRRVVELGEGEDLLLLVPATMPACDEDLAVPKEGRRGRLPRHRHRSRGRKRARGRVEDLGRGEEVERRSGAADDEHTSVVEEDGLVVGPQGAHRTRLREPSRRRVVDLGRIEGGVPAAEASSDQDTAILEPRCTMGITRAGHLGPDAKALYGWVVELGARRRPILTDPEATSDQNAAVSQDGSRLRRPCLSPGGQRPEVGAG
jgi:hypothetical protein